MMDMSEKVIAVIGATGQQGGSVARRFLQSGNFHVRALTRSPTSPAAQALASLGAEIVRTDLFDIASLKEAVRGVNVVFSVTNYWAPFAPNQIEDSRRKAKELGMNSVREYAGYLEEAAGRNIADAVAATAETLEGHGKGFLVSTLSHAKECSKGRFEKLYHFDAKAKVFPGYVEEKYPELVNKMSSVQTGFFFGSHLILPDSYLAKTEEDKFEMRFSTVPEKSVPHLDPVADMGKFVYAVYQTTSSGGQHYMAEGTTCSWPEWIAAWSRATGVPAKYRQITRKEMIQACGDEDFGGEIADMFEYSSDPGYDGAKRLLRAEDLRQAGAECSMTTLDDWMKRQDWRVILSKGRI